MLQKWPEYRDELSFPREEEAMGLIIDAITAIRAHRNEMNVAPSKKVHTPSPPRTRTPLRAAFRSSSALPPRAM